MAIAPIPLPRSARPPATGDVPGVTPHHGGGPLGNALGWNGNPFYDGFRRVADSGVLDDIGYGLLNSTNIGDAFAMAGNRSLQMAPMRRQDRDEAEQRRKYAEMISGWGPEYRDFAEGIEGGAFDPADGYWKALQFRQDSQQEQEELARAQGNAQFISDPQLRSMVEAGALDFKTAYDYQMQGNGQDGSPTVVEIFDPQTGLPQKGYMQGGEFVPLGGTKAPAGTTGDLSATETRELFETEDNIQSANNVISALDTALDLNTKSGSGWGAEQFAGVGANLPDWVPGLGGNETRDANTLQLKNIVTEQALSQLKLVFGAAPTEGERQILLEIQGSVNQPEEVRKRIFERAKELALIRLQFNEGKKQRIEQGAYGAIQQPGQMPSAAPGGFPSGAPTATNPQTGEVMVYNGQQWVPAQ